MDILPTWPTLVVFLGTALALALTPGPVVLYIITRSIEQGRHAGLASAMAGTCGNLVHVLAASFGLSAILSTSALAFDIIKYIGAAYLIYIGARTLLTKTTTESAAINQQPIKRIFRQGLLVAIFNPKTALFFLAFLPQFVDRTHGPEMARVQLFMLGVLFVCISTITDSTYAIAAGTAGKWLRNNRWFHGFQRYVAGTIYIGLGLAAAFSSGNHRK
jgi:threonine/homoserine/homoserine lactone efflux protein